MYHGIGKKNSYFMNFLVKLRFATEMKRKCLSIYTCIVMINVRRIIKYFNNCIHVFTFKMLRIRIFEPGNS